MTEHLDIETLHAYIDVEPGVDRAAVADHLAACEACRLLVARAEEVPNLLRDRQTYEDLEDRQADSDRHSLRDEIRWEAHRMIEEEDAAEVFVAQLQDRPVSSWEATLMSRPEYHTGSMVQRLLALVDVELDRNPEQALRLVHLSERIAYVLDDVTSRASLGDVWKHRANALRHLARYTEALDAVDLAETFYASLLAGDFDLAQARYTRAAILFKMTRYSDALAVLEQAQSSLQTFGTSVPLAKTMVLHAAILQEQGDLAAAMASYRDVIPLLSRMDQPVELARIRANLADASLQMGDYGEAFEQAKAAISAFRELSMDTERIRAEWTIAMINIARGQYDEGLDQLYESAAAFEARGMSGDAGFVKLDIVQELLRRGEWPEAEAVARELATLFSGSGVTLAKVTAIGYLRTAVENREATVAMLKSIREFVLAEDDSRTFVPPLGNSHQ